MHGSGATIVSRLQAIADEVKRRVDEIEVVVVCNRRTSIPPDGDFAGHSLASEFYADHELDEVIGALRREGFLVSEVIDEQQFMELGPPSSKRRRHCVLMNFGSARRGPWGKTLVPALAEVNGWVTTSSDAYAIALARHKFHTGAMLEGLGIASAHGWCYSAALGWIGGMRPPDGTVVLVQPAYESASIGVDSNCRRTADCSLDAFCTDMAANYHQDVIVRKFVTGYEVEVPIVRLERNLALDAIGISLGDAPLLGDRFLTYEMVAKDDYGFYYYDNIHSASTASSLMSKAEHVAEIMGLRGFCRIDFRVDAATGEQFVTDVAANPHFISHSSFAFAIKRSGTDPAILPLVLIGLAMARKHR